MERKSPQAVAVGDFVRCTVKGGECMAEVVKRDVGGRLRVSLVNVSGESVCKPRRIRNHMCRCDGTCSKLARCPELTGIQWSAIKLVLNAEEKGEAVRAMEEARLQRIQDDAAELSVSGRF